MVGLLLIFLVSAALLLLNEEQFYLFVKSKPVKQKVLYSDRYFPPYGDCSLLIGYFLLWSNDCTFETSGQSYKQFTIVIYDSRVVIWGNFKSGTTLES